MSSSFYIHFLSFALQHRLNIQSYEKSHPLRRYYDMCIRRINQLENDAYAKLYLNFCEWSQKSRKTMNDKPFSAAS